MIAKKNKQNKWFFGWENIKWFIREFRDIYSPRTSYFSKKRIESSIAFIIGQIGMILFLQNNLAEMDTTDIVMWAGVEFAISGYIVTQIQKEKKTDEPEEVEEVESVPDVCPTCSQEIVKETIE